MNAIMNVKMNVKMIALTINGRGIRVPKGTTLLGAANKLDIPIPSMCFYDGEEHYTSCMICVVEDKNSGRLLPACSARAEQGQDIATGSPEVLAARKTCIELLLGEHAGDCEGPCRHLCPAHMNIPAMLRHIEAGNFRQALVTVKAHIALPAVLGYICPAPCEKGCRRSTVDRALSICELKKFTATLDLASDSPYIPPVKEAGGHSVAIVGTGAAGLAAAYYLQQQGHSCTLFDRNDLPGGNLRYSVPTEKLPHEVLDAEIDIIRRLGAAFQVKTAVGKDISMKELKNDFSAIILAVGKISPEMLTQFDVEGTERGIRINNSDFSTGQPAVFAGGEAVRPMKMAVMAMDHGRRMALSVNRFLGECKTMDKTMETPFSSRLGKLLEGEAEEYLKMTEIRRGHQGETPANHHLTTETAISESARCLHCECLKPDTCKLRQYAETYGAAPLRFKGNHRKKVEKFCHNSHVVQEPGKCIKCGLCVRISRKSGHSSALTFIGRGFTVEVGVPLNKQMDPQMDSVINQCVDACPTGALAFIGASAHMITARSPGEEKQ